MAATVRGTFELIDRASSTLKRIEQQALKTQIAVIGVGSALDAQQEQSRKASAALATHADALKSLSQEAKTAQQDLQGLSRAYRHVASEETSSSSSLKNFQRDLHGTRKASEESAKAIREQTEMIKRGSGSVDDHAESLRAHAANARSAESSTRGFTAALRELTTSGRRGMLLMFGHGLFGSALGGSMFGLPGMAAGAAGGMAAGALSKTKAGSFLAEKSTIEGLTASMKQLKEAGDVAGEAFAFLKDAAIPTAIRKAIAAVDALSTGLIDLLQPLGQLGNSFFLIPTGVAVAAQAMSAFKLATQGVGAAIQAAFAAQTQWALNQRQWSEQVLEGQQAVQDSVMGVAQAVFSQTSAQHSLTDAIFSQTEAQASLTAARRDAIRTLQDMEFAAKTAILQEAQAGLNIQQARIELQQAMATPGTTQLQIEQDRLAVLNAQAQASQTHVQAQRQIVDYSRVMARDPSYQPVMEVAQAQHALKDATFGVVSAQEALRVSAYGVVQALRGVHNAQFALQTLYIEGNAGVSAFRKTLLALGPAARQFVNFIVGPMGPIRPGSLFGRLRTLENYAGTGLFPKLEQAIIGFTASWGPLDRVMQATGTTIGTTFGRLLRVFDDPKGLGQMEHLGMNNVAVMKNLGDAFVWVARAIRTMLLAAEPIVLEFSRWIDLQAKLFAQRDNYTEMRARFDRLAKAAKEVGSVLYSLWEILKHVFEASSQASSLLWSGGRAGNQHYKGLVVTLRTLANATAEGTRKFVAMQKYFITAMPTLRMLGHLLGAVAKAFLGLGDPEGQHNTQTLFGAVTKMVPVVAQLLRDLDAFSPALSMMFTIAGHVLSVFVKIASVILSWKPIAEALGFTVAMVVVGRFIAKLATVGTIIRKLWGEWQTYQRIQNSALSGTGRGAGLRGLFSPGARSDANAMAQASVLNRMWGLRSEGPGSMTNPLVVQMLGSGTSSPMAPADKNAPLGSLQKMSGEVVGPTTVLGAGQDVSRLGKIGYWLENKLPGSTKYLSKIPGLGGLTSGFGAASDVSKVAQAGTAAEAAIAGEGATSALGALGGVASKFAAFAGPLGAAVAGIPALISGITAGGNLANRAAAAGNTLIKTLTFGLAPNIFGGTVSRQQEYQQGARASQSYMAGIAPLAQGDFGAYTQSVQARLAALQRRYNQTAYGTSSTVTDYGRFGAPGTSTLVTGQDAGARQRVFSDLVNTNRAAASTAAQTLISEYTTAIQSGREKPNQAMSQVMTLMQSTLQSLQPQGKAAFLSMMAQWGATLKSQSPQLTGPVDTLNNYIQSSFSQMGQNVNLVNGQIITNSAAQWQQIQQGITSPAAVAQEKLKGTFGQIYAAALGSLKMMGYSTAQAQAILKGEAPGAQMSNSAAAALQQKVYGGAHRPAVGLHSAVIPGAARGGRIPGSDMRDVYRLGASMVGGGELVMNRWQEAEANSRLMRHGEPTVGTIVANRNTPHWLGRAGGGRLAYGGYIDPIPGFTLGRTDMGVDADAPPGTPILAFGPSRMVGYQSNWYQGQPEMVFQLTAGPDAGRYWYVAEEIVPQAHIGQALGEGQVVARFAPAGTGIEIGWAANAGGTTLAQATTGYSEGQVTQAGQAFRSIITGGRQIAPVGGGGAVGATQMPPLKVPRITGLGGVPYGLAFGAARGYARGLTQKVNSVLASASGPGGGSYNVPGGGAYTPTSWAATLLRGLGYNPTSQAIADVVRWEQQEGGNWANAARFNPLNTTQTMPGSTNPGFSAGVQAYTSWQQGLEATIKTLRNGSYAGILQALGAGAPLAQFEAAVQASPWGTHFARGGRLPFAGWFAGGGSFVANTPTLLGVGEGGRAERVTVTAAESGRPVSITINKIEVNRKGDVQKIVDEEMRLLADALERGR